MNVDDLVELHDLVDPQLALLVGALGAQAADGGAQGRRRRQVQAGAREHGRHQRLEQGQVGGDQLGEDLRETHNKREKERHERPGAARGMRSMERQGCIG